MDTSKLIVKLPVDKFYDTYVETIRDLYDTSFIEQNHLEPSTKSSFQRVMSKRAGISLENREDTKQYTKDDLIAIITDTNEKYEEYVNGDYSESTKARGEARYRLLATALKETFLRLGYNDLAEQFKHAENSKDTATENVEEAYKSALAAEKEEEDNTVRKNIEMLRSSLSAVRIKIDEFRGKELSKQDKESLQKLYETLKDTIASATKLTENRTDVTVLKELIEQGEGYIVQIQEILASKGKEVQQTIEQNVVQELPDDISKMLSMLPRFIEGVQSTVQKNEELLQQVKELQAEVDTVKKQTALPDNDEGLITLIKDAINAIEDTKKLKDIGMLILMKTM